MCEISFSSSVMFLEVRSLTTVQSPIILKLQLRTFLICPSRLLQVRIVYPQVIQSSRTRELPVHHISPWGSDPQRGTPYSQFCHVTVLVYRNYQY